MKWILFLLFLNVSIEAWSQNTPRFYMMFEQNEQEKCIWYSRTNNPKKITIKYTQKRLRKMNQMRFILCKNIFLYDFNTSRFELINEDQLSSLPKISLQQILDKEAESEFKENINTLFPELYILEKAMDNSYIAYKVVWEKSL